MGSKTIRLHHGDCRAIMRGFAAESIDAIVTDPPYELGFMGKAWDGSGIAYDVEMWREALRVLKPGGHLLAFGGTRTYHRMACAIEDAGFEIRDCIQRLYGSGFPKSHDVSKAIDKQAGAEREVIGAGAYAARRPRPTKDTNIQGAEYGFGAGHTLTAPATPEAKQWDGWGTALKPANEPIVLARKPFKGTVANNVLAYGTGALNIDGCRIHTPGSEAREYTVKRLKPGSTLEREGGNWRPDDTSVLPDSWGGELRTYTGKTKDGRWPANVILDECAAAMLDEQSGERPGMKRATLKRGGSTGKGLGYGGTSTTQEVETGYSDTGGASRFFYVAKASKRERNAGLEGHTSRPVHRYGAGIGEGKEPNAPVVEKNFHPTVKPIALMRYLVRLITPPGGIVLDPFAGSGTTGIACIAEGVGAQLIEMEEEYVEIAAARIRHAIQTAAGTE